METFTKVNSATAIDKDKEVTPGPTKATTAVNG